MSEWIEKPIKGLGRLVTGKTPPKINGEYFENGEELFVSPKDLDWDQFYVNETETVITEKALEKFKNQVLPKNSVMFTSLSFAFGKMGITSKNCLTNQQINSIIVNDEHDYRFVYYLLKAYRPIIFSYNSGIDTPIVPKSVFESILVKCPLLPTQQKIAAILSAYDELIENNKRRIVLLETMAEEIYREWFVRFRFPSYQTAEFEKGVPKGWKIKSIGSKFKTYLGGTPSRNNLKYWDGDIPWINSGEVNKSRIIEESEFITEEGLSCSAAKLMPERTTVLAITGATLGQVSLTEIEVSANQSVVGIHDQNNIYNLYIFENTKSNIENIISKQSGGGQQHINKDIIEKELILLPPEKLVVTYNEKVSEIYDLIKNLLLSNKQLRKEKEMLLPRLIAGKLSVENLDIQFPPSMQEDNAA